MDIAKKQSSQKINLFRLFSILLILFSLGLIIHRAWLCDDAFITFRTLDNFVNGYRLTWNIYERVQVYTHPLWLFLLIPIYALTREIFLTVISVMVILSAFTLVILYRSVEDKKQLILPLIALAFSNAFINYSTSGLENSLLNCLLCLFLFFYVKRQKTKHYLLELLIIASLISLTRLDAILIIFPAIVYSFFNDQRTFFRKIPTLLLGFSPLILWELFSLFYYGFPFPNTYYAKLTAGAPLIEYLQRGIIYFWDSVIRDPITIIGLLVGILFVFILPKMLKPFSAGILLYFLYVFTIGGDFMAGRMFVSTFFMAMILIAQNKKQIKTWLLTSLTAALVIIGFLAECPTPFYANKKPLSNSIYLIMDERRFYSMGTGLFRNNRFNTSIEMDGDVWSFGGYTWIAEEREAGTVWDLPTLVRSSTGLIGYLGGPELKIVDDVGLSDPLIARLPAVRDPNWRIGHLVREMPEGYVESITNPAIEISDPQIEEYNDHLEILTQSKLFSKGRIIEIIRFNLGVYDHLIEQ